MKFHTTLLAASALIAVGIAAPAFADSISPSSYTATTTVGGTLTLHKTVTVNAGTATTQKADVLFLSDTTGSMGPAISTVKTNFAAIAAALPAGTGFAVGEFKDKTDGGDAFNYKLDQDITHTVATAQTAINGWSAGGGGDDPEQGLNALSLAASTTSWDAGAKRIIIITGDAPEHTDVTTVAGAASALVANNVTVESVNVSGLTGDSGLNSAGQFSGAGSIYAAGVAGTYSNALSSGGLVAAINAALASAFANYSDVTLQVVGASGVSVAFTPADITGTFDRSIDRTFGFDLTFTGLTTGVHNFTINALLDGGIIGTETDSITVTGGVPEPASWAMMLLGFGGLGAMIRRRRSTAIAAA